MAPKFLRSVHVPHRKNTQNSVPQRFFEVSSVTIPMSMHIGAPAKPVVKVGDHVKTGQLIGEPGGFVSAPIHASISGTVKKVDSMLLSNGGSCMAVTIESDGLNEKDENLKAPELTDFDSFIQAVRDSGIVGLGGAGFPTSVKLAPGKPIEAVLLNGCECEPMLTADHKLLLHYADEVIFGLKAVMKAVEAPKGVIVIEDNKPDAVELLKAKCEAFDNIEVTVAKTKYPQGAEKMLIKRVLGRMVPSGGLPADVGAVVCNVSTVKAISDAIQKGMPLIERVVSVTGERIKKPGNYIIRIGTDVKEVIDYCGGITGGDDYIVKMGGPMMGILLPSVDVSVIKGTNGIIAIEKDESEPAACIKCGRCVDVCPMELSPLYFAKYHDEENWQGMKDKNVMDCMECRCCEYICSSKIPLLSKIKAGKAAVRGMK